MCIYGCFWTVQKFVHAFANSLTNVVVGRWLLCRFSCSLHWTLSHRLFPLKHPDLHMLMQAGGNVIWSCVVVLWLESAAEQPQGKSEAAKLPFFFLWCLFPPLSPPPLTFLHGSEICGVCTEQKCSAQALQLWTISFHCTHELSWSLSIMFQSLVLKVAQMGLPCVDLQYCSLCVYAFCFEIPRL